MELIVLALTEIRPAVWYIQFVVFLFGVCVSVVSLTFTFIFWRSRFKLRAPIVLMMASETFTCCVTSVFAFISLTQMSNDIPLATAVFLRLLIYMPALVSTIVLHITLKTFNRIQEELDVVDTIRTQHSRLSRTELFAIVDILGKEVDERVPRSDECL